MIINPETLAPLGQLEKILAMAYEKRSREDIRRANLYNWAYATASAITLHRKARRR